MNAVHFSHVYINELRKETQLDIQENVTVKCDLKLYHTKMFNKN
jgi:hypothetical protein